MSIKEDFIIHDGVLSKYTGPGGDVFIPEGVTTIGWFIERSAGYYDPVVHGAFSDCTNLTSVTIPEGVTTIDSNAFRGCTSLSNVTFPDSLTTINSGAFRGCTSLSSVSIPENVTHIGHSAFYGCLTLTNVTIPDSVIGLDKSAFYDTSLYMDKSRWESGAFYIDRHLIDVEDNIEGSYTIKAGTRRICNNAFYGCTNLTSVTIPEGAISIGLEAFRGCSSLRSVTLPNSVSVIDSWAFADCINLSNVVLPEDLISIGSHVFQDCSHLESRDGLLIINGFLFEFTGFGGDVKIPAGVTTICGAAFSNGPNLPVTLTSKEMKDRYSRLTSVTIPDGVTIIGECAFQECVNLRTVAIPDSVNSIGMAAFNSCSSLTSVTLPASLTTIGFGTFGGCTDLTDVTIPKSVTSIDEGGFFDCPHLTIHAPAGSYAEHYAKENSIRFIAEEYIRHYT